MEFASIPVIEQKLQELKKIIYPDVLSIPVWKSRSATYTKAVEYENFSPWSEMTLGTSWICRYDETRWFEATVTVPESYAGKRVVLDLDLGGEGLVTINGKPVSSLAHFDNPTFSAGIGFIRNRTRVDITDCAKGGEVLNISVQLGLNFKDFYKSGNMLKYADEMTRTHRMERANLCTVDAAAEGYYHDMDNVVQAIGLLHSGAAKAMSSMTATKLDPHFDRLLRNMSRDSGVVQQLIHAAQSSMVVVPFFRTPEEMRQAVPQAAQILKEHLEKMPKVQRGTVYVSGFAHLDLVWLWQMKHSVRKMANTCLNVLALIERYPHFVFTCSQPYAFKLLEDYYPDIFRRVQEKVASGNISIIGNLWVEMDTNLSGGEAIVRQLLYGREYYLEKFGKDSNVFFMPDSFGFAASLPQIIKKSGIDYFMTNKLQFNEHFRFPYSYFRWKGIDGTEVPAFIQRVDYGGNLSCERLDACYHRTEDKRYIDATYMTFGYGDGGGGADYVMLEDSKRINSIPGIPDIKMASYEQFYAEVFDCVDQLPVWEDELYLDKHRGTYTTQAFTKKANRMIELALRKTELAATIRAVQLGISYPAKEIEEIWKQFLPLQFHDGLPGSSITQVYEDVKMEVAEILEKQQKLFDQILSDLTAAVPHKDSETVVWNFLPWQRTVQVQVNGKTREVLVPAMGWAVAEDKASDAPKVSATAMENKFYKLTLDEKGHISSLIYKATGREVLRAPSNVIEILDDPSQKGLSAWDIEKESRNVVEVADDVQSICVAEQTDKRGVVRIVRKYNKSTITQDIILYSDIERIDVVCHVDWQECMRLMKAAFYPAVHASRATYEIQFGAIERATHWNTGYDASRFEACAHKWADLSQGDFGLSILNDCKYGYDIHQDKMRITLLKASLEPDYLADRGEHDFTYSLYPHTGTWAQGGTVRAGYELNVPAEACAAAPKAASLTDSSFVQVEGENVVLDSIKLAQDGKGYIVRLYEAWGCGGKATVTFAKNLRKVTACDLMEQNEKDLSAEGNSFTFETAPYCIHSYRVEF